MKKLFLVLLSIFFSINIVNAGPTITINGSADSGVNTGDVTLAVNHGLNLINQILSMGTPSSVTSLSTNSVTTNTHSHAFSVNHNDLGGLNVLGYRHVPAAVADNDFNVGQASDGNWLKKTLAETRTILGLDGATTTIAVGGGSGVAPLWTTATGTGAPVRAGSPTFTTSIETPQIYGSTAANGDITIEGTSSATKTTSYVNLQPTGGNVGIGTAMPGAKLEVIGVNAVPSFAKADAIAVIGGVPLTGFGEIYVGSSTLTPFPVWIQAKANDGAVTYPMSLQPLGGNVGIGNAAPAYPLDVTGNIRATGNVLTITTHGATEAATSATMYGQTHRVTGAYTITLPAAVVGMSGTFRATTAAVMSLDSNAADQFVLNGGALTAGYKIISSAVAGESVWIECVEAQKWDVYPSGIFSDGGA